MANPNPWEARQAKARKRLSTLTTGDIQDARKVLWLVLSDGVERIQSLGTEDHNDFYKLTNAITGAVREFRSLVEATEIEQRVTELERKARPAWTATA